jgi:cyclophilin family peptidyl-prolyl cis-trans isomerase
MTRALLGFVCVFALACTTDPTNDESASETADDTTEGGSDEIDGESEESAGTEETVGTEETMGTDESTDTGEVGCAEPTGEYGHGNLHPDCMGDNPQVLLQTTLGDMVVQLDAVRAPITVANYLGYVSSGFYDGTIFHRVIDGFVIQGGGMQPGLIEKPTEPPIVLEIHPELRHDDGAISMARTPDPDSATSQFYVCDGPQHGLDDQYAVFGVLIEGFEVRDAISMVAVHDVNPFTDVPVEDVVVERACCVMP